jgi:hypothetical protein
MKQMTLILLFLAFCSCLFAQQVPDNLKSQDYYLEKSRNQKLAAWPLLVAGVGMTTLGIFNWTVYGFVNTITGEERRRSRLGALTAIAGGAAIGGSLALFSGARRNKQRAADVEMYPERLPIMGLASRPSVIVIPAIRVKIPL